MKTCVPFSATLGRVLATALAVLPVSALAHEHPSHYSTTPKITNLQDLDSQPYVEAVGIPGASYLLHAAPDFGSWEHDAYGIEAEPGHYFFFNNERNEEHNQLFRVGAEHPNLQAENLPPIEILPDELQGVVQELRNAAQAAQNKHEAQAMRHVQQARQAFAQLPRGTFPGTFEDFARLVLLNLLAQNIDDGAANQAAAKVWNVVCVKLIYISNQGMTPAKTKQYTDLVKNGGAIWRGSCVTFKPEEPIVTINPATIALSGPGFQRGDTLATFLHARGGLTVDEANQNNARDYKVKTKDGTTRNTTLAQFWRALKAALANHAAIKDSKCLIYFIIDTVRTSGGDAVPGFADQPGRFGFITGDASPKHIAHEFGHNAGLGHTNDGGIMEPRAGDGRPRAGQNNRVKKGFERAGAAGALALGNQANPVPNAAEEQLVGLPGTFKRLKRLAGSVNDQASFERWKAAKQTFIDRANAWAFDDGSSNAEEQYTSWEEGLNRCEQAITNRLAK